MHLVWSRGCVWAVALLLVVVCCSCTSSDVGTSARRVSIADLPVEKFDQYLPGHFPPEPWRALGGQAPGLSMVLDGAAESSFIGNTVNGVGLVIEDTSDEAGSGLGIATRFAPPPAEPVYLGFDFRIVTPQTGVRPTVSLGDGAGPACSVELYDGRGLSVVTAEGTVKSMPVKPGQWYHAALIVRPDEQTTTLVVSMYRAGRRIDKLAVNPIGKQQMGYDLVAKLPCTTFTGFNRLAFRNVGPDSATGTWHLDNIVMGGRIDVPRQPWWPFDRPSISKLRASDKKVFAYYYSVFSNTVSPFDPGTIHSHKVTLNPTNLRDKRRVGSAGYTLYSPYPYVPLENTDRDKWLIPAMEMEVRLAREMGLDGFLLDFWAKPHPTNGQRYFIGHAWAMLEAVQNVDPGFKIIPSIYAPGKDADPHEYAKSPVVRRVLKHPACYRLPDGRRVLSMWRSESQPPEWWKTVLADLKKDGIDVALLGHFNSPFDELKKFRDVAWCMTIWGTRSPQWDYAWPRAGRKLTDVVGTPIAAQDIRTRGQSLWEAENFDTLRSLWHSARKHDADYAFIISWNDFSEQAQMPSERVGYALHDLNAYYTTWFKTGRQPTIVRDVLYYSYRRQHSKTKHTMGKPYTFRDDGGSLGDKAAVDKIELLAFLTRPGTLTVEAGGKTYTKKAPAGITSFKVPMPTEGEFRPVFTLVRDGHVVVTGTGRYLVTDRINFPDLLYNSGVIAADD